MEDLDYDEEREAQEWEDACNEMKMREAMWIDNGCRWIAFDDHEDYYHYY